MLKYVNLYNKLMFNKILHNSPTHLTTISHPKFLENTVILVKYRIAIICDIVMKISSLQEKFINEFYV